MFVGVGGVGGIVGWWEVGEGEEAAGVVRRRSEVMEERLGVI